ncbi:MAG: hypothetical protein KDC92_09380 [Bacteroidetes bacterium]|nr:hypothetical protein [Bacteroidota bacterium]
MLKNWLKKHFTILKVRDRLSPQVQLQQRQLYHYYKDRIASGNIPALNECGHRVFSQFEEDGLLLFILAAIGMKHFTFLDIGSDDGINSNCANLAFHFGYHGLFIDGNPTAIERGRRFYHKYPHPWTYKPTFKQALVKRENINQLIADAGFEGEIDVMSIDIDGNDYWVWDALMQVSPRVVVIETHIEFGLRDIVVPYDPNYVFPGKHPVYHGASPVAMVNLAKRKGYRLVGANQLGFNFIFVKNGEGEDALPEVSVESVLTHPSVKAGYKKFEPIKDWEYVSSGEF